jgi:hypothetical protein
MEPYETRLKTARHRVEEQEQLIAAHRETISDLREAGEPTELAEKMLQLMERRLDDLRADLAKLAN